MTAETRGWLLVSASCIAISLAPVAFLASAASIPGNPHKEMGLAKIQPGEVYLVDSEAARNAPENQTILITEALNRKIAATALNNPGLGARLRITPPSQIAQALNENLGGDAPELVGKASGRQVLWSPNAGEWGMFIARGETPPARNKESENLAFGFVELPGGLEKSRFMVERDLNNLLQAVRRSRGTQAGLQSPDQPENALGVLREALRLDEPPLEPEDAVELYGLAKGLNIQYSKKAGLFLNPKTELAWETIKNQ
jgi:hypothetical protein